MIIRYVLGRPIPPKEPKVLKSGALSTDVRQDTTLAAYLAACEETQTEPKADFVERLKETDQTAWVFRYDMFCSQEMMNVALYDVACVQKQMAKATPKPPRNQYACDRCDWRVQCEGDPMAQDTHEWPDIEYTEATPLRVKYGRTMHSLDRDRWGFVVSPSELRSFMTCQRQWSLSYVWRMRIKRQGVKSLARVRGSLTHEALRLLAKNQDTDLHAEIKVMIKEMFDRSEINEEVLAEIAAPDQVDAICERARSMFDVAMEGVVRIVEFEQRRIVKMIGTKKWLHGIPDAVVELEGGQLAVIEYKTTSSRKDLPKLADTFRGNPAAHLYCALVQYGQLTF